MKSNATGKYAGIVAIVACVMLISSCAGVPTVKPGCENAVLYNNQMAMIAMDAGQIGLMEYLLAKPENKPAVHQAISGVLPLLDDDKLTMADLVNAVRSAMDNHPAIQSRLSYLLILDRYSGGAGLPMNDCDREYLRSYFGALAAMTE